MDMRQALMLFTLAHALGYYYLSSFKPARKAVRLIPELLLYTLTVALVFSPVLDGNNYLYALAIVLFHFIVAPVCFAASRTRARYVVFILTEVVRMTGFTVMAFIYSVRWGAFEPWRDIRFLLMEYALDFNQVLSYAFAFVVLLRPVNIVVRSLLALFDGGDEAVQEEGGRRRLSVGPLVGIVERMFYFAMAVHGSWIAFAIVFFAKCALFCLAIRDDADYGQRLYIGSILSAFSVIPVAFIARPFF